MFRKPTIIIAALAVFYVAVRLWRLSDSCLWFDEIFSVHAAGHEWSSLFWFVAQDLIHPPLFYALLKLWIGVGGESVFWLRLLPVVFSTLAIFPFVRLCRELKFGTPVVLLSLFLMAVNGALIKYTQTLRMYSMRMLMALLSMWLFARYFNRGKSFVLLLIVNVLLVYTHYFGWLVIGTEIGAILIFQRIKWRRAVVMTAIVSASFIPWLIVLWQAARSGSDLSQNIAWQTRPRLRELFTFAIDLVEPLYFQASNIEPPSIYLISIPLLFLAVAVLVFYLVEWKNEAQKQSVFLLLLFAGVPFLIAFIASWILPHSVWGTRHMIIILPPVLILFANTISLPGKIVRMAAVSIVVGLSMIALAVEARRQMPVHVWCAWNDVAENIRSRPGPTEIYAFENLVAYHLWFALRDSDRFHVSVIKGVDARTDDETYFLPRGFEKVSKKEVPEVTDERLWLAFRTSKFGEDALILETFGRLGYAACRSEQAEFDRTTVYWVEMVRHGGCSSK